MGQSQLIPPEVPVAQCLHAGPSLPYSHSLHRTLPASSPLQTHSNSTHIVIRHCMQLKTHCTRFAAEYVDTYEVC